MVVSARTVIFAARAPARLLLKTVWLLLRRSAGKMRLLKRLPWLERALARVQRDYHQSFAQPGFRAEKKWGGVLVTYSADLVA